MVKPLTTKPYQKWRRKTAKRLGCSMAAIDRAWQEGLKMLQEDIKAGSPLARLHRSAFMPAYATGLIYFLYNQNPTLRMLAKHGVENPRQG
jgi:hypothetical protein